MPPGSADDQQPERSASLGHFKARLQGPNLAYRQTDTLGQGGVPELAGDDFVTRFLIRLNTVHSGVDQLLGPCPDRLPEQSGEQEIGRDRFILGDPAIRPFQRFAKKSGESPRAPWRDNARYPETGRQTG